MVAEGLRLDAKQERRRYDHDVYFAYAEDSEMRDAVELHSDLAEWSEEPRNIQHDLGSRQAT